MQVIPDNAKMLVFQNDDGMLDGRTAAETEELLEEIFGIPCKILPSLFYGRDHVELLAPEDCSKQIEKYREFLRKEYSSVREERRRYIAQQCMTPLGLTLTLVLSFCLGCIFPFLVDLL